MRKQVVVVLAGIVAVATSTPAHSGFLTILERIAAALAERAAPKAVKPLEELAPKAAKPFGEIAPAGSLIGAELTAKASSSGPGAEFVGVESFVDDFADDKWGELLHHLSHATHVGHLGHEAHDLAAEEEGDKKP